MTAEASEDPASGQAGQTGQAARTARAAAEDSADSAATGPAGAQAPAGAAAPGGKPIVAELPGLLLRKSRRFPLITRDTARPQGGGRAAPGSAPSAARQWPFLAVVGGVALGLLIVALDGYRLGTALIGLSLLAGAALRWALPEVGMLAVRSRFTDLLTYGGLGAVILLLSLMVQPNPWIKLPFLQDVVHFTVR
ncbi:DUF3017 domain-containing protein [Streptomyces sp. BRA346]|uniref:DUF3017 domain-containing protein n=1 Tax=Streptomyces sp. BRA346 TaxID=2878199 RepID=UPI004063A517